MGPTEETRPTLRRTENADRTTIIVVLDQANAEAVTKIDIDIAVLDNETNEEVSGKHIHVEREGLIPSINAVGSFLSIVANRLAYAVVDEAQKNPGLAKKIGLEEGGVPAPEES